ncbi:hypothetical protein BDV95DRAFT_607885 [Massariosphaeria phaeospora]|uniref:Prolyl 4-hydroxylase alpha subunit Fe(2+) 2OG dioxygenase domain-containing protein n=1 Tax=Massariosphaeria phaeospora TaxID=100035 RepID=A0A7C8ICQ0_9PLEO|nr:hypothetical protein BDV95DRAFT_607885 [Massariosphaeria phaeospora]
MPQTFDLGSEPEPGPTSIRPDIPANDAELLGCKVRERLDQALSNIVEEQGEVLGIASIPEFCDPLIHIGGYGPISLPLTEEDTQYIIHSGHQAPFGKGSETIIDRSVRQSWELDARELEINNPSWQKSLDAIAKNIAEKISVDPAQPGFHVELYKMLLYEKGAMFKPHRDTEKVPGMFGTLVVCLPCPHTGGDVRLQHHGRSTVLQTSSRVSSILWWYSDVHHEVLPIESGYRWVLTYNLVRDCSSGSLPILTLVTTEFEQILRAWKYQLQRNAAESKVLV